MEDTSVLRLFLTTLLLLSAATTDICGCGDACGGRDQGWPTDFAVDEAEETVKLRCYTGCTEEVIIQALESDQQRTEEVDRCLSGCISQYINRSLSTEECTELCGSGSCSTGCTIYEKHIKMQKSAKKFPDCPNIPNVGNLSIGEQAFISLEQSRCQIYTCRDSPVFPVAVPFEANCSAIAVKNCHLNVTHDSQIKLAKCCGYCPAPPTPESPPVLSPADDSATHTEYIITIPEDRHLTQIAYLLRVKNTAGNETVFLQMTTPTVRVSLLPFTCTRISVSYAVVNRFGASGYSPTSEICINPPFMVPGPPVNLEVSFEEDLRPGFVGHAFLYLMWDIPENLENLDYYQLDIDSIVEEGDRAVCKNQEGLPIIENITRNATSFTVVARNDNEATPPRFNCKYHITLTSVPGVNTTTDFRVAYTGQRSTLPLSCVAKFNPTTAKYDIVGTWTLPDNPLAVEAIRNYVVFYWRSTLSSFIRLDLEEIILVPEENETLTEVIVPQRRILLESEGNYFIEVNPVPHQKNDPLFWRRTLVPDGNSCSVTAPPVPPTTIENAEVSNLTIQLLDTRQYLQVLVMWDPPLFPNGELTVYQLRIGREAIGPGIDEIKNSLAFRMDNILPSVTEIFVNTSFPFAFGSDILEILYLQVRSGNVFEFGEWSQPVSLNTSEAIVNKPSMESLDDHGGQLPLFAYTLFGITAVVVMAACIIPMVVCCYKMTWHWRIRYDPPILILPGLQKKPPFFPPTPFVDKWELSQDEIHVFYDERLGKGCFGEVYRGQVVEDTRRMRVKPARHSTLTVAVKRLKDNSTGIEKDSFLKEIENMKKVSEADSELGRFVVKMVGCVTIQEPLLLVLEYVKHGDLYWYLRTISKQAAAEYYDPSSDDATPYLEPNGIYSELSPRDKDMATLEQRDLLEFSRQIACGMEFLSSLNIVHRDLACRNILVGERKRLKISDFGLSRLVPADEVYVITNHGLLPLRWMALESIFHREFISASDVWSYGVVLWEICTMGAFPYATLNNTELTQLLKKGYRMEKPANCSTEVYEVMLQCWSEDKEDRPSFGKLHIIFDQFLSKHIEDRYPYMEVQMYTFDKLEPQPSTMTQDSAASISIDIESGISESTYLRNEEGKHTDGVQLQVPEIHSWRGSLQDIRLSPVRECEPDRLSVMSAEREGRYVESPVAISRTSTLMAPDLSIQEDLLAHLERTLSNIGTARERLAASYCPQRPRTIHTDQPQDHTFEFGLVQQHTPPRIRSMCAPEVKYENYNSDVCICEYHDNESDTEGEQVRVIFRETDV